MDIIFVSKPYCSSLSSASGSASAKDEKTGRETNKNNSSNKQQQQRRKSDRDPVNAKTIAKIRFLLKYYFLFASLFLAWIKRWTTTEINEWIDITERLILMIKLVNRNQINTCIITTINLGIWVAFKKKKWFSHRKEKISFPKLRYTSVLTKPLHTLWSPLSLSLVYSWRGQQPSFP